MPFVASYNKDWEKNGVFSNTYGSKVFENGVEKTPRRSQFMFHGYRFSCVEDLYQCAKFFFLDPAKGDQTINVPQNVWNNRTKQQEHNKLAQQGINNFDSATRYERDQSQTNDKRKEVQQEAMGGGKVTNTLFPDTRNGKSDWGNYFHQCLKSGQEPDISNYFTAEVMTQIIMMRLTQNPKLYNEIKAKCGGNFHDLYLFENCPGRDRINGCTFDGQQIADGLNIQGRCFKEALLRINQNEQYCFQNPLTEFYPNGPITPEILNYSNQQNPHKNPPDVGIETWEPDLRKVKTHNHLQKVDQGKVEIEQKHTINVRSSAIYNYPKLVAPTKSTPQPPTPKHPSHANPKTPKTSSTGKVEFDAIEKHIEKRFSELEDLIKAGKKVVIAGRTGQTQHSTGRRLNTTTPDGRHYQGARGHTLGVGRAKDQWTENGRSEGYWLGTVKLIDKKVNELYNKYQSKINFGNIPDRTARKSTPNTVYVWGANSKNWNVDQGTQITGNGQAKAIEIRDHTSFGIVTTPADFDAQKLTEEDKLQPKSVSRGLGKQTTTSDPKIIAQNIILKQQQWLSGNDGKRIFGSPNPDPNEILNHSVGFDWWIFPGHTNTQKQYHIPANHAKEVYRILAQDQTYLNNYISCLQKYLTCAKKSPQIKPFDMRIRKVLESMNGIGFDVIANKDPEIISAAKEIFDKYSGLISSDTHYVGALSNFNEYCQDKKVNASLRRNGAPKPAADLSLSPNPYRAETLKDWEKIGGKNSQNEFNTGKLSVNIPADFLQRSYANYIKSVNEGKKETFYPQNGQQTYQTPKGNIRKHFDSTLKKEQRNLFQKVTIIRKNPTKYNKSSPISQKKVNIKISKEKIFDPVQIKGKTIIDVNFANALNLGGDIMRHDSAQEEKMATNSPAIMALAFAQQGANRNNFLNLSPGEGGALLYQNFPVIDDDGTYHTTNQLAIAAHCSRGENPQNTLQKAKDHFQTALNGFSLCREKCGNDIVVRSGLWGSGAFENSRYLMLAVQILAAKQAGVDLEISEAFDKEYIDAFNKKIFPEVETAIRVSKTIDEAIEIVYYTCQEAVKTGKVPQEIGVQTRNPITYNNIEKPKGIDLEPESTQPKPPSPVPQPVPSSPATLREHINLKNQITEYTQNPNSDELNPEVKQLLGEQVNSQLKEHEPKQAYKGCGIKATFNDKGELVIDEIFAKDIKRFYRPSHGGGAPYDISTIEGKVIKKIYIRDPKDPRKGEWKEPIDLELEEIAEAFHNPNIETRLLLDRKAGEEHIAHDIVYCKASDKNLFVTQSCESARPGLKGESGDRYDVEKHGSKAIDPNETIATKVAEINKAKSH